MFKFCLAEDKFVILYLLTWLRNKQVKLQNFRDNKTRFRGMLRHRPKQQQKKVFIVCGVEFIQLLVILVGIPIIITKEKYCRNWGAFLKYVLKRGGAKWENYLTQPMVGTSVWALRIFFPWCKGPLGQGLLFVEALRSHSRHIILCRTPPEK